MSVPLGPVGCEYYFGLGPKHRTTSPQPHLAQIQHLELTSPNRLTPQQPGRRNIHHLKQTRSTTKHIRPRMIPRLIARTLTLAKSPPHRFLPRQTTSPTPSPFHTTTTMDTSTSAQLADEHGDAPSRRGGRGNRFRPRGGGSGSGSGTGSRDVALSRALSRLLRHQASSAGVPLDKEGYADLSKVVRTSPPPPFPPSPRAPNTNPRTKLQWPPIRSLAPTFPEILAAVRDSDKQRFSLRPNAATNPSLEEASTDPSHWLIRANQGHSIKLESDGGLLRPLAIPDENGAVPEGSVAVPPVVVHGTYFAFWLRIVESGGLKAMGRNHVHCSTGVPEGDGVVSGMRRDAEVVVEVDVEGSMREEGMRWWVSENGVVLTEGREGDGVVGTRFFKEARGRAQGVGVLWREGEWVADLPEGVKVRVPQGKGRGGGRGRGGRGGRVDG